MPLSEEGELRSLIDDLQEQWTEHSRASPTFRRPNSAKGKQVDGDEAARIVSVIGFARHVHETVKGIVVLLDAGLVNQAIPLVRLAYETSLTAAWLVQAEGGHGSRALIHEYARQRLLFINDAKKSASPVFREGLPSEEVEKLLTENSDSHDSTRNFQATCLDLEPGGLDAYIHYRALSGMSHAGVSIVDRYFKSPPQGVAIPEWRPHAEEAFPRELLLFFSAASMVWADRAFIYMSRNNSHRNFVRSAAPALGIDPDLKLSDAYRKRHLKRRAERRQDATRN